MKEWWIECGLELRGPYDSYEHAARCLRPHKGETIVERERAVVDEQRTETAQGPATSTGARPWNAMPHLSGDVWTVEREIVPVERKVSGQSYRADVLCEVHPTEPRYGEPARTAEENAKRIADALNDVEGWYGPRTEAARAEEESIMQSIDPKPIDDVERLSVEMASQIAAIDASSVRVAKYIDERIRAFLAEGACRPTQDQPTSTAGETWAKGFRAGEEQAAETLGENGHYEAAKFLRETFKRERSLEMPPERPAAGEAFRLVLESIAATSEDQDTRTLASAILNEPGHRTTEQRSVLKELATELGVDRIDAPRRPTARVDDSPNTSDDEAIDAAHPLKTGRHDLYAYAMQLVGARHDKGDLVDLVNWLLYERAKLLNEAGAKPCIADDCKDENAGEYALCPAHLSVLIDALKSGAGRESPTPLPVPEELWLAAAECCLAALRWVEAREAERARHGLAPTAIWQAKRDAEARLIMAVRKFAQIKPDTDCAPVETKEENAVLDDTTGIPGTRDPIEEMTTDRAPATDVPVPEGRMVAWSWDRPAADSSSAAPVDEHAPRSCEAKVLGGTCEPAEYAIDWELGTKVYCERCADGFVIVANNVGQKLAIRELPRTAKASSQEKK